MPEFSLRPTPQKNYAQFGIQLSFIPPALAGGSWVARRIDSPIVLSPIASLAPAPGQLDAGEHHQSARHPHRPDGFAQQRPGVDGGQHRLRQQAHRGRREHLPHRPHRGASAGPGANRSGLSGAVRPDLCSLERLSVSALAWKSLPAVDKQLRSSLPAQSLCYIILV